MAINYGSIGDDKPKPPKKGKKSNKLDEIREDQMTPEALERHLAALAYQSRSAGLRCAFSVLHGPPTPRIREFRCMLRGRLAKYRDFILLPSGKTFSSG